MKIGVLALQGAFREHRLMVERCGVQVLASVKGKAVIARQGKLLVTAFHPELTCDDRIHRYFINMIKE